MKQIPIEVLCQDLRWLNEEAKLLFNQEDLLVQELEDVGVNVLQFNAQGKLALVKLMCNVVQM